MQGGYKVIAGLGETGLSYARWLAGAPAAVVGEMPAAAGGEMPAAAGGKAPPMAVHVLDDAPAPEAVARLRALLPRARVGGLDASALAGAETIYLSPGVPLRLPAIAAAREQGVPVRGDVELFAKAAKAPLVAVTGTNGKSTVAQLIYLMAAAQRDGVRLGGNIGRPCLDLLTDDASLYVLEVSSYQLELAAGLQTEVALVLNLSPDHLDRYDTLDDYYRVKLGLYKGCRHPVVNRGLGRGPQPEGALSWGLDEPPGERDLGARALAEGLELLWGRKALLHSSQLRLAGAHNAANALAALAAGVQLGLGMDGMLETLRGFGGLPHRGEWLGSAAGVGFVNDSKATNPGAMAASIRGFASGRNVLLICGGEAKGLGFAEALPAVEAHVKQAFLIGADRARLAAELPARLAKADCGTLEEAVRRARKAAVAGDLVLLAPGCASTDQFRDFAERGERFRELVGDLLGDRVGVAPPPPTHGVGELPQRPRLVKKRGSGMGALR